MEETSLQSPIHSKEDFEMQEMADDESSRSSTSVGVVDTVSISKGEEEEEDERVGLNEEVQKEPSDEPLRVRIFDNLLLHLSSVFDRNTCHIENVSNAMIRKRGVEQHKKKGKCGYQKDSQPFM